MEPQGKRQLPWKEFAELKRLEKADKRAEKYRRAHLLDVNQDGTPRYPDYFNANGGREKDTVAQTH